MVILSPYLKHLLDLSLGTGAWQLVPLALGAILATIAALAVALAASNRASRAKGNHLPLEPHARVHAALAQLKTELAALGEMSPPSAVRIVEQLLLTSMSLEASDIHLSPLAQGLAVSIRVHGVVHNVDQLPTEASSLVINRLKVLAKLDLHARQVPQDGHLTLLIAGRTLEARISTLPTENGERIVLRLVEGSRRIPGLSGLGFSPEVRERYADLLSRPQGVIFVTGPVGSGKSTTLYAGLAHIAQTRGDTTTIVTLEDPVELRLPFATQTQVNHKTNLTFASVLRSVLRQDPNVLMVGEIRDRETADIAMQAGLTGHLLLTTIHAQDAVGAFARLVEMGIDPFTLANSVTGSLSQRLVRRLCPNCRTSAPVPPGTVEYFKNREVDLSTTVFFEAPGCAHCDYQGYVGRCTLSEVLVVDSTLKSELHQRVPIHQVRESAVKRGMTTLLADGLRLARSGDISLTELLRVTE